MRPRQHKPAKSASGSFDVATAFNQAMAFHRAGRLAEAEAVYRQIIAARPDHFDSLHLLGVIAHQKGDHAEAVRQIDAALALNPKSAAAHSNRGSALKALKRFADALASYDAALTVKSDHPEVLFNRGTVLQELERYAEALTSFDHALTLKPDYPDALINRGSVLQQLDRVDEALASYDRALALNPNYAQAHNNRGTALKRLDRTAEALAAYDKAIALKPNHAEAHVNRGQVLRDMRRFEEALASFDRAIALRPDHAEAFYSRGSALRELNRFDDAVTSFDRAITLKPGQKYLEGARLYAKMHVCDWRDFDNTCSRLIAAVRNGETATAPFTLLATPSTPIDQRKCAEIYVADKFPSLPAPLWRGERYAHDRIRVAYLSADYHDHATAYLMAGLFEAHDRSRFETIAISFGPPSDGDMRRRLRQSFDRFIDVPAHGEQAIADLVRELEVDIAVDLKGFTQDSRLGILARRPAPIQVSYLGFPGTMGASFIDYILVDSFVAPPDRHDAFAEKVVCLPDSYYPTSYPANEMLRGGPRPVPSRTAAGLPERGFVFCSFNNSYKITPDIFDIWMRLLQQIEGSVLWLLQANSAAPSNLQREALQRGVAADRLIFAPRASFDDHLARQRLADLFLDTRYYNAHTTASDALWAGLPVVTCPGVPFASRVAGSLLTAAGLPELITASLAEYETLALQLARDPTRLAAIKSKLARHRDAAPAFNTARLIRHIEAAYVKMWERYQRGETPEGITVQPIEADAAPPPRKRPQSIADLAAPPDQAAAHLRRGALLHQQGRLDDALASYDLALSIRPDYPEVLNNSGALLQDLKRHDRALASYDRAVALKPDYADAHYNRSILLRELGRADDALASCDAALALRPDNADALNHRGMTLQDLGRSDEALASYDRAVALRPDFPEAHYNRGITLGRLGRHDDALAGYDSALALKPDYAEAHNNRGTTLRFLNRLDEALASYDRAIALDPGYAEAFFNRGNTLPALSRLSESLASYDQAVACRPDYAEAYLNRGDALAALSRYPESLASYDRAIALRPDYTLAYFNRGITLESMSRFEEAVASYDRAVALDPDHKYLLGTRLHAKMHLCDWRNFDADCAQLLTAVASGKAVSTPFPLLAIPSTPSDQRICAETLIADFYPPAAAAVWSGERYAHERIRVAYLSADFYDHATAVLMARLFECHDRSRFETFAISFGRDDGSAMLARLKQAFDRFIDVRGESDDAVAKLMRSLEIDIAVDLKGFTHGARTRIFAARAAPIQVSYLGYPGTMGASYIDYLIADHVLVPPERRDGYSERIVCLPDSYQVNDRDRKISEVTPSRRQAGLPEHGFVFCSFNNSYKITPDIFDVWMRLLREIDGSVLWLMQSNSGAPVNLRREADARGVSGDRLIFAPRAKLEDHLARHRLADLFLDTHYCNAHTTTSDALWAGLPVLTCAWQTFAGRVAGSLLHAVGLPELVTRSLADYEALALKLARDPELLAGLRQKLACNRKTHPLFDAERLTRHIEASYVTMWERHQRGEAPADFSVMPR